MKITFCLPSFAEHPIGGFKMVFEYANRLSKNGHKVNIVFLTEYKFNRYTSNLKLKKLMSIPFNWFYPNWFELDRKVSKIATPYLDDRDFPNSDIVVATAVNTAQIVSKLPKRCGEKYYFIQGFENWTVPDEEVYDTYKLGMKNIVVSNWLYKIVKPYDPNVKVVKNPIDTGVFKVKKSIYDRNKFSLCMLYHKSEMKGIPVALKAIDLVKEKYPDLKVTMFGVHQQGEEIKKEWITYYQKVKADKLCDIYNNTAIFVCASVNEGFGLTGAESMACGNALASTSYKGVFEYAVDKKNALLSPVNNYVELANNIIKLIEDDELRIKLAEDGSKCIGRYSFEEATKTLEDIFTEGL